MEVEEWEKHYAQAYANIKDPLKDIRGVFVAHNNNIDAIKHINEKNLVDNAILCLAWMRRLVFCEDSMCYWNYHLGRFQPYIL
jgi:hypothetical protein